MRLEVVGRKWQSSRSRTDMCSMCLGLVQVDSFAQNATPRHLISLFLFIFKTHTQYCFFPSDPLILSSLPSPASYPAFMAICVDSLFILNGLKTQYFFHQNRHSVSKSHLLSKWELPLDQEYVWITLLLTFLEFITI